MFRRQTADHRRANGSIYGVPTGQRAKVCDFGCGTGALLADLSRGYDMIGVDPSPQAREYCQNRGIRAVEDSLPDRLPAFDAGFDAVIVSDVLEHIREDQASVRTIASMLAPGGILVATVPGHPWMWTRRDEYHHHVRRYTRTAFAGLFESAGLHRELLSYYNVASFPLMASVRMGKKWLGIDRAEEDIRELPATVNRVLRFGFEVEKRVLTRRIFLFGAPLIAEYRMR